jgi:hypothetical protein
MTIRSPDTLRQLLDNIMSGLSWRDAMAAIGARTESSGWTWKHKSREAQAADDTSSIYFIDWPVGSERQWFHELLDVARDRRGAILGSPFMRGEFAVSDGRVVFERDDFGAVIFEGDVPMVAQRTAIVEPVAGKHRPNPDDVLEASRRPLAPASYSGNKPKVVPVPAFVGNALGDYLKEAGMTIDKQPMTPLRRDLLDKLAAAKADPGRASAKPRPITVLGRPDPSAPQERISRPSDQTGLPTNADDAPRRAAPQPKPAAVDYSRRAPPVRLDSAGRG